MSQFEEYWKKLRDLRDGELSARDSKISELEEQVRKLQEENTLLTQHASDLEKRTKFTLINIHTLLEPLVITDATDTIRYVSDSFLHFTGYTSDQVTGKSVSSFLRNLEITYKDATRMGVTKLHFGNVRLVDAQSAESQVTVNIFQNRSYGDEYNGMAFVIEPLARPHRARMFLHRVFSLGSYHEIKARDYVQEHGFQKDNFLTACISPFGTKEDPKKKAVVVSFDGVASCEQDIFEKLARQHEFLEEHEYQMFVTGVLPESEFYHGLVAGGFPAEYIVKDPPKRRKH